MKKNFRKFLENEKLKKMVFIFNSLNGYKIKIIFLPHFSDI